jgi:DNA-3-methyladenine glycosylase I
MSVRRCEWPGDSPLQIAYHDTEWGTPQHEDARLFELLTLEGAQAGLSWDTILRKRDGYRRAFAAFDPERVARFTPVDAERLMRDPSIVRNRLKIESTINNARAVLAVRDDYGSFDAYLWRFMPDGRPVQNRYRRLRDLPASTALSTAISRDLKRDGFRFVGPTTVYAFMQAAGMVNDHTTDCYRWRELCGDGRTGRGATGTLRRNR